MKKILMAILLLGTQCGVYALVLGASIAVPDKKDTVLGNGDTVYPYIPMDSLVCDTIYGRNPVYYYGEWYDTCRNFQDYYTYTDPSAVCCQYYRRSVFSYDSTDCIGRHYHNSNKLKVHGLVAMVYKCEESRVSKYNYKVDNNYRKPEYLRLYEDGQGPTASKKLLASVRWDTASPRRMVLPRCQQAVNDTGGYRTCVCYAYEALLDQPVELAGDYYILGTQNSNTLRTRKVGESDYRAWWTRPVLYYLLYSSDDTCRRCLMTEAIYYVSADGTWTQENVTADMASGPFLLMVSGLLQVRTGVNNGNWGTVTPSHYVPGAANDTIKATAVAGYCFAGWADGDTTNPRVLKVVSDTAVTALFEPCEWYRVMVAANNPAWGSVYGDGTYPPGSVVTVTATAYDSLHPFVTWSDGVQDNPRVLSLVSDTLLMAIFSPTDGVAEAAPLGFAVTPNPAHDCLLVTASAHGDYTLDIYSTDGKHCLRHAFQGVSTIVDIGKLSEGTYLLVLQDAVRRGIQKLIKY